jgi:hypothetical protein
MVKQNELLIGSNCTGKVSHIQREKDGQIQRCSLGSKSWPSRKEKKNSYKNSLRRSQHLIEPIQHPLLPIFLENKNEHKRCGMM